MKSKLQLLLVAVTSACLGSAVAAPNTLRGGSDYEKRLEQAGMSGMSGMSGMTGTSQGEPEKKKVNKKAAKKSGKPASDNKAPAR